VGAAVYAGAVNPPMIVTSMDDPFTSDLDGFTMGNTISVVVWSYANQTISENYEIEFITGDAQFTPLGSYIGEIKQILTSTGENGIDKFEIAVSPNPAEYNTFVTMNIPVAGSVTLRLTDVSGKYLGTVMNAYVDGGFFRNELRTESLQQGYYLLEYKYKTVDSEINGYLKIVVL